MTSTDIHFYFMDTSSCSRMIWMILEEMGLKYTEHRMDLTKGEQKTEAYKKINRRQKVPAIVDGDLRLAESRAIATYLVNQYGEKCNKQSLYPVDAKKRAIVDQHLYISEDIWAAFRGYANLTGIFAKGQTSVNKDLLDEVKEMLKLMEESLNERKFVAADHLTLADFFYYVPFSFLAMADYDDYSQYPKLEAWKKTISEQPYFEKTFNSPQGRFKQRYVNAKKANAEKGHKF